jgi:2-oxoisovalerate dehydrogenase E2 component (dihydrolipoyl transacylase)
MARRQFKLPDVGEGLTEGEILTWHVKVGDLVTVNQVLVEVETAKAAVELPSPYAGEVLELLAAEGATVDVGVPIITIETEPSAAATVPVQPSNATKAVADAMGGEEPQVAAGLIGGEAPGGRTAVLVGYGPRTTTAKRRPRRADHSGAHHRTPAANADDAIPGGPLGTEDTKPVRHGGLEVGRLTEAREKPYAGDAVPSRTIPLEEQDGAVTRISVLAKPPVRKMARDLGVDLRRVSPTGPNGTITREDVAAAAAPQDAPSRAPGTGAREERIAVKGVRRMTAQAMVASAFTAPHVTEFLTVDVTRTMEFVARLRAHRAMAGLKVSPLLVIAKALCLAVRRTPEINASWDAEAGEIVLKHYVNLGIAAATPRGLLVPNLKDADAMTLPQLAAALSELTDTAREGRTAPADMAGGTITITNVGVFGVDAGTPIINPGEAAILCVGTISPRPWVVDGAVVPRQVTTLSLSFDHRMVDGEGGSRFLVDVGNILEDPASALLF